MNFKSKGCLAVAGVLIFGIVVLAMYLTRSYNTMVKLNEGVKEKWSQVENVYQRRADLIPNLVETVKGVAAFEKETFIAVAEARSNAKGTFNMSEEVLSNPEMFEKFQQAQNALSSALQRLMVVVEKYPELKANQNFLNLQDQLEGTENRITVERRRFNETAREFNVYINQFPRVLLANLFGFREKAYFKSAEGAETAPRVQF